jgi:signal peptidase I
MDTEKTETKPEQKKNSIREIVGYAIFALAIVIPIRMYIAQPFVVNGASMDSTFSDGEYLIIDEISYRFNEPERGEVIVFKYPLNTKKYFIKRIIGLPGEKIVINGNSVKVINTENPTGIKLTETYIHTSGYGSFEKTLGADEYFVMGDNRLVSSDSRYWGALDRKLIVGKPIVRLLPFSRIDVKPGEVASSTIFSVEAKK